MIDIIIPAYNAHETIHKTLFSICLQDIVDKINVIIIDDCSSKPYDYLVNDFKDRLNITLYRLDKNRGPGYARNKGLELSKGEYIIFIDADDLFVNNKSVSGLYNKIRNYDLVIGLSLFENSDNSICEYPNHDRCLHGKMYKKSYIDKYNIRFNDLYRHEDSCFHEMVLMSNPSIGYVDNPTYLYTFNGASLTHKEENNKEFYSLKDYIDSTMMAINKGLESNFDKRIISDIAISSIIYLYYAYQMEYDKEYKDELLDWIYPLISFYNENKEYVSKRRLLELYKGYGSSYNDIIKITLDDFINKSLNRFED